jgi:hypothetical protein
VLVQKFENDRELIIIESSEGLEILLCHIPSLYISRAFGFYDCVFSQGPDFTSTLSSMMIWTFDLTFFITSSTDVASSCP